MNGSSGPKSSPTQTEADPSSIAIAHWGEHVNGGGDRVAWELTRVFEDAPFFVGWRDPSIEPEDVESRQLINGTTIEWALRRGGIFRMLAHLIGWQKADPLRGFDVLVTSGNEPLFYVPPTEQVWVAYVHHTNRRQSDQISNVGTGTVATLKLLFHYLVRVAFDHNTHKPDLFLSNSEQVKRRMVRYWGVPEEKIRVVYPPIDTAAYSPDHEPTGSYYLTLSRLDWHKNVDEIVETFEAFPDLKLVVAGDGPERARLEELAGENVEFHGYVSEEEKRELLSGAKAFVFNAREEDFGISPVEAIASGTPLLGVREGITQFQVVDGKNGYTHDRAGEVGRTLAESIKHFEANGVEWTEAEIASFADRFSVDAFHDRVRTTVADAVRDADITPDWYEDFVDGTKSETERTSPTKDVPEGRLED